VSSGWRDGSGGDVTQLSQELPADAAKAGPAGRRWLIQDGSLFAALPRMYWALWRRQGQTQSQVRLRDEAVINVEAEPALQPADRQAKVVRAAWARLGCKARYRSMRLRVVWVQTDKEVLRLVTNLGPEELWAGVQREREGVARRKKS